ncbi:MAG: hypothetical protein ACXVWT_16165 [Solirubrobacteraceae bacterium]
MTFSVEGVAWLSGVYRTVAEVPIASLVPGAAGPEPDDVFDEAGALDDAGVDAAGVGAAGAGACELDDELLPPQAASPAARPAVARTTPAPLRKPNQGV